MCPPPQAAGGGQKSRLLLAARWAGQEPGSSAFILAVPRTFATHENHETRIMKIRFPGPVVLGEDGLPGRPARLARQNDRRSSR